MDDESRILEDGAVAVTGNRIVAVDQTARLEHWQAARRIDCRGQAIIPGLIDCHNHLFQAAGRGLGDGMALWQWLGEFMLPLAANIGDQIRVTLAMALCFVLVGGPCIASWAVLGAALQSYLQQGSRLRQFNTIMGGLLAVTALGMMWV